MRKLLGDTAPIGVEPRKVSLNPDGTASGVEPTAMVSMRDVDGKRRCFYGEQGMKYLQRKVGSIAEGELRDSRSAEQVVETALGGRQISLKQREELIETAHDAIMMRELRRTDRPEVKPETFPKQRERMPLLARDPSIRCADDLLNRAELGLLDGGARDALRPEAHRLMEQRLRAGAIESQRFPTDRWRATYESHIATVAREGSLTEPYEVVGAALRTHKVDPGTFAELMILAEQALAEGSRRNSA